MESKPGKSHILEPNEFEDLVLRHLQSGRSEDDIAAKEIFFAIGEEIDGKVYYTVGVNDLWKERQRHGEFFCSYDDEELYFTKIVHTRPYQFTDAEKLEMAKAVLEKVKLKFNVE